VAKGINKQQRGGVGGLNILIPTSLSSLDDMGDIKDICNKKNMPYLRPLTCRARGWRSLIELSPSTGKEPGLTNRSLTAVENEGVCSRGPVREKGKKRGRSRASSEGPGVWTSSLEGQM